MTHIDFNKPKKARSTAEHNEIHMSDSGVNGTYVPNMSDEDAERWRGKHIKGENERIEIRKSFPMAQIVIVVRKFAPIPYPKSYVGSGIPSMSDYAMHKAQVKKWEEAKNNIKISMNGSLWLSHTDWLDIKNVVSEAEDILSKS